MSTQVSWFRHNHENRNDLLRMGLMGLHFDGAINYTERTLDDAAHYGFSKAISSYPDPRHLSFILVEQGRTKVRVMVDSEDSFALISPLVKEVDVCFCAGYNSDFFERKQFVQPYSWQTEPDIAWYRDTLARKVDTIGGHFHKIKKYVPIGPNLSSSYVIPGWKQKMRNLEHKVRKATGQGTNFKDVYRMFRLRYSYLLGLRNLPLKYDITLNDSLWGWPQHRIRLHHQLAELKLTGFDIRSRVKWNPPVPNDGSDKLTIDPTPFPMETGLIDQPYEEMLAQSKLAVFACGFHWGWRNIMMVALMTGIPVYTDRLLTEAYFNVSDFKIFEYEDVSEAPLASSLEHTTELSWNETKEHNQMIYDQFMSPEAVATYFLEALNKLR